MTNNLNTVDLPSSVARTLVIGYTKVDWDNGYSPRMDGYKAGAEQHEISITVDLPPDMAGHLVAELVFIATNAPNLEDEARAKKIHDAIKATGYNGQGAHWSLSVGDTVTVDGTRYECQTSGWQPLVESDAAGKDEPPVHCGHCDAPLHRVNGRMVDLRNAAHGGTYDHCPVNPTHEHKAVR